MATLSVKDAPRDIHSGVSRPPTWVLYLPLGFFLIYLNLTVALFAFGPWKYPVADGRGLYGFLLLAHVALAAGYLTARWNVPRTNWSKEAISLLLKICLAVTIILLIPTSLLDTGRPIPNVVAGIADPGVAYAHSLEIRGQRAFVFVSYIRILVGPLLFLLFPLLVVYWQDLSVRVRILGVSAIAFGVAISIADGVNKGLVDLVGLAPVLAVTGYFSSKIRLTSRQWVAVVAGWLVAVGLVMAYFGATQSTRIGSASKYGSLPAAAATTPSPIASPAPTAVPSPSVPTPTPAAPSPIPATYPGGVRSIPVDYGHPLVRVFPHRLQTTVVGVSSYLTQGYYGLYLSLRKPFVPMFGVGNSLFLTQQAVRITGNQNIAQMSYPSRIQQDGWDALGRWSSIYPWIASDVSFPGTIVVVFLIGRFFAMAWFDAVSSRNPFAFGMVALFAIMLFYFPANNQTSQFGEEFTAFWGILIAWLLTRNGLVRFNLGQTTGQERRTLSRLLR
jgi:hypothetical protein